MARPGPDDDRDERNRRISGFFDVWTVYQKAVAGNHLAHRETYTALRSFLEARVGSRPFTLLDLGCGDASFIAAALRGLPVRAYHGIDLSATALALAREQLAGLADAQLEQADLLEGLRRQGPRFDVVFAGYAVHHLPVADKSSFLGACRGRLAPGGVVALIDVMRDAAESRDDYLARFAAAFDAHRGAYAPGELDLLLGHVRESDFPESLATYARLAGEHRLTVVHAETIRELFGLIAFAPA